LRDNSVQMPHFTLSLLQTLLRLPREAAFVSVYESNSDDGVHGWIDVMQLALNVIGTPNRLVARGMLVRGEGQHRCAKIRIAASFFLPLQHCCWRLPCVSVHICLRTVRNMAVAECLQC
jgi:hypothetical protein